MCTTQEPHRLSRDFLRIGCFVSACVGSAVGVMMGVGRPLPFALLWCAAWEVVFHHKAGLEEFFDHF